MAKLDVTDWLRSGKYLPAPLRDFHDQKSIFKAMHTLVRDPEPSIVRRPDWVEGQVYVIDVFLWFMAKHGWTLQRTRREGDFLDLNDSVRECRKQEASVLSAFLTERSKGG